LPGNSLIGKVNFANFGRVIYQEHQPHPSLRAFIECYWWAFGVSSDFHFVYPDGCTDIIFNFGDDILTRHTGVTTSNKERAFVVGSMLAPIETRSAGTSDLFGIRFHPGAMTCFTNVPIHELNDDQAALRDILKETPDTGYLRELTPLQRADAMDKYFFSRIPSVERAQWLRCLQQIVRTNGQINLHALQKDIGISERQLERKFRTHVGPGPKQLAQVLRFRKIRASLDAGSSKSLLSLAFDFGFTDHAHLTRFFKLYSGRTPTEYLVGKTNS
jgi:AraC-like DNA-binding protein